jgi:hypothetical protein
MFCLRTFCPSGCFLPTNVLSAGCFVLLEVLSRHTFCPARHFVPRTLCLWLLCRRTFCLRTFCPVGCFVSGRFVWAPFISSYIFDSVGMKQCRRYSRACVLVPQPGIHQSYKLECSRRSKPNRRGGRGLNEFHLQGET